MKARIQQLLKRFPDLAWAAALWLLAFAQYAPSIGYDFAWDDDIVILHNQRVQQGFASIPGHFAFRTRAQFEDFTGYRPVTMTSFSIDVGLFGLSPRASHAVNVLLYAVLVVVLFRTLRRLFPDFHAAFAFFVTLLFLVHPIHVEAVANVKSRDEILALLFALLALGQFVQLHRSGKWWRLGLATLFLTLGALSKEGALTYLAVIPVTVVTLLDGGWRAKARLLAQFAGLLLLLVGVFWLLTGKLPGSPSPVSTTGYQESQTLGNCMATDAFENDWERIGNSTFLYWENVGKFCYPVDLVYFSGYDMYPLKDWTADRLLLGPMFLAIVVLLIWSLFWLRRWRPLAFGFWYFCVTIAIYLQPPGFLLADTIADRFLFMPSVGLCVLTVYLAYRLLRIDLQKSPLDAFRGVKGAIPRVGRTAAMAFSIGLALLSLVLGGMSFSRSAVWKDNLTLFSHDLPLLENCARAHYYYASELVKGLPTSRNPVGDKAEIERHYLRAIAITPQSYYAYLRLGQFYNNERLYAKAADLMEEALRLYPAQADIWTLRGMGLYYLAKYSEAAAALEQAKLLAPELLDNWEFLARAYERGREFDKALATLREAMQRNPVHTLFYDVLSDTYFDMGDQVQAFATMQQLLQMEPDNPGWWRKIIGRYQMVGDDANAAAYYQEALRRGLAL